MSPESKAAMVEMASAYGYQTEKKTCFVAGWEACEDFHASQPQDPTNIAARMGADFESLISCRMCGEESVGGPGYTGGCPACGSSEVFLNKFMSGIVLGESPDTVAVPKWMQEKIAAEIIHRLKRAREKGSGFTLEQEDYIFHGVDMTFEAIKAIRKDV